TLLDSARRAALDGWWAVPHSTGRRRPAVVSRLERPEPLWSPGPAPRPEPNGVPSGARRETWRALRRLTGRALVVLALVETGFLAYPPLRAFVLALVDSPAARCDRLATELGRFPCPA